MVRTRKGFVLKLYQYSGRRIIYILDSHFGIHKSTDFSHPLSIYYREELTVIN